ncbi:ArsR/SmtB family transcription factor [Corynebacterium aquilae]|uniref:ArsR/SmtB family transcription factor n=1 Tax=Corynebacterium aquilae TaxID=203263 RepID=UPI000952BEDC|nr:metalloregulator ArsR/SmtB family transcription factor [Corynebacterium aquilae]
MNNQLCHADVQTLPGDLTRRAADFFRAISDPTRLKLLYLVAGRGSENICSHELAQALQVAPPTVTHHMKRLAAVGLVERHQQGKWAYYTVNNPKFCQLNSLITALGTPCPLLEDGGHCIQKAQ